MAPWYEPTESAELRHLEIASMEEAERLLRWSRGLEDNPVTYEQFLREEMSQ